mmetsp:Transcript_13162/g.33385  ORF Transcript_13162/g.33385 Transcript_13162/m.33385 type:complete len:241 (-) Transcript_13162:810-1532(-)
MRQDWCHGDSESFHHEMNCRLTAASSRLVNPGDVKPVFRDIEIKIAQIDNRKLLQSLIGPAERIRVIRGFHLLQSLGKLLQDVFVEQRHVGICDGILRGVKVFQTTDHVPHRVPQLAVDVRDLLDDPGADQHVTGVVDGARPQAENIRAKRGLKFLVLAAVDDAERVDHVADALGHLRALLVQHKPVGDNGLVGRVSRIGHRSQQRALEPPAMLVIALQNNIRRKRHLLVVPHHGSPRRA